MSRQNAQRVNAGSWRTVRNNPDTGAKESILVQQTVPVGEQGEQVSVKTEDGRTIQVTRKVAELYPERYTPAKAQGAQA